MFNILSKKKNNFFLKDTLKNNIDDGFVTTGKWSYGNPKIYRWSDNKVIFGNFCSIGPEVSIYIDGNHNLDSVTTSPLYDNHWFKPFECKKPHEKTKSGDLVIEHDVWIGARAIIFSGITIGTGAVIGAGSVVKKDVLPYSVVAGNPAIEKKKRFDEKIIAKLLDSKWWELEDEKLFRLSKNLISNDIHEFLKIINDEN